MEVSAETAVCQEHHPPAAVRSLHQVPVSGSLNLGALPGLTAMGEDGIGGIGLIGTVDVPAACHGEPVRQFSTALGNQEIVPAVLLIDMRAFRISAAGTAPQQTALSELFTRLRIYLREMDASIGIGNEIALPILEQEGRIDAALLQPNRV